MLLSILNNIPVLWSRPAMFRARTIPDLTHNRDEILAVMVDLNLTAVGHFNVRERRTP